jgi:glycerol-3-phosphate acyltransferase PlsY
LDESAKIAAVIIYGYLLGSVNSAFIAGKLVKGIDLRKVGSGTVGAANVWYHVGHFWIFPVGVFDMFVKGMTPVYIARYSLDLSIEAQAAAGLMAVVGHNWPVFLRFHGGRGVAPTIGALLALARIELVMFIVLATAGWRLTNSSAVWVLIGMVLMPMWAVVWGRPTAIVAALVGLAAIAIVKRLMPGTRNTSGTGYGRLMLNRLLYDRDIADHDAWVQRGQGSSTG